MAVKVVTVIVQAMALMAKVTVTSKMPTAIEMMATS